MPIDDCPHSFHTLVSELLPAHMERMRQAISSPVSMVDFGTRGIGQRTILKKLRKQNDFSGCYVLLEGATPIYVGISRSVVQRLLDHVKGTDYYTATLAYQMAVAEYPNNHTAKRAMEDKEFMQLFAAKKESLSSTFALFLWLHSVRSHFLSVFATPCPRRG